MELVTKPSVSSNCIPPIFVYFILGEFLT